MSEPFQYHDELVERFWAENAALKGAIFHAWYLKDNVSPVENEVGREAVARFIGKGAIRAAQSAIGKYERGEL